MLMLLCVALWLTSACSPPERPPRGPLECMGPICTGWICCFRHSGHIGATSSTPYSLPADMAHRWWHPFSAWHRVHAMGMRKGSRLREGVSLCNVQCKEGIVSTYFFPVASWWGSVCTRHFILYPQRYLAVVEGGESTGVDSASISSTSRAAWDTNECAIEEAAGVAALLCSLVPPGGVFSETCLRRHAHSWTIALSCKSPVHASTLPLQIQNHMTTGLQTFLLAYPHAYVPR